MAADESFIGFGLHDAVLETIRVDWVKGTAELAGLGSATWSAKPVK